MRRLSVEVKQMAYDNPTVLDGTNPTLDASDLFYEFEKAKFTGSITRITTKQDLMNNLKVA